MADVWADEICSYSIPKSVSSDIDILSGASHALLKEIAKIESMNDSGERSKEALEFIESNLGATSVRYSRLISGLANPSSESPSF